MARCFQFYVTCTKRLVLPAIGIVFLSIIVFLLYHSYESLAGNENYCTLWTDIPGRLSILFLSYYITALCGCLPLPNYWRLRCIPEPLLLWKFWTWKDQLINISHSAENEFCIRPEINTNRPFQGDYCPISPQSGFADPFPTQSGYCTSVDSGYGRISHSYGATRNMPVPINANNRPHYSKDINFGEQSSIRNARNHNSRHSTGSVRGHPQRPWAELRTEHPKWMGQPPSVESQERHKQNKSKFQTLNRFDSPSNPIYGKQRQRCVTEPNSGDLHQMNMGHMASFRDQSSASSISYSCSNGTSVRTNYTEESNEDSFSEQSESPRSTQFHMS